MDRLSRKVSFSVLGGKTKVVTLLEVSDKEQGVVALTYHWQIQCLGKTFFGSKIKNVSPNVGLEPTTPRLRVSCSFFFFFFIILFSKRNKV